MRMLLPVLLGLAIALVAQPEKACAQNVVHEIKLGVLYHDPGSLWSTFSAEPASADLNIEVLLAPSQIFMGGTLRPALGGSINTQGATSSGYIDARWQYDWSNGMFFGTGVGVALHDGHLDDGRADRKQLGSRVLFHIPIEVGYRFDAHSSFSVYFEHMSNAYIVSPNEGLDRLGVRYGYRF
jgi:lipid A 3-O-deacylase